MKRAKHIGVAAIVAAAFFFNYGIGNAQAAPADCLTQDITQTCMDGTWIRIYMGAYETDGDASTAAFAYANDLIANGETGVAYNGSYNGRPCNSWVENGSGSGSGWKTKYVTHQGTEKYEYAFLYPYGASYPTELNCPYTAADTDGDGIEDELDDCESTPTGYEVDSDGCWNGNYMGAPVDCGNIPAGVYDLGPTTYSGTNYLHHYSVLADDMGTDLYCVPDADQDGVGDVYDNCSSTTTGDLVDDSGCSCDQGGNDTEICGYTGCCTEDADGDGVEDDNDNCPNTPSDIDVDNSGCSCDQGGTPLEICGSSDCCDDDPGDPIVQEGDVPTADEIGQAVHYYMAGSIPTAEEIGQAVASNMPGNDYESVMDAYRAEDHTAALSAKGDLEGYAMPTIGDFETEVSQDEINDAHPGSITEQDWYGDFMSSSNVTNALTASGISIEQAACAVTVNLPRYGDVQLSMCGLETALANFGNYIFLPVVTLGCLVMVVRG